MTYEDLQNKIANTNDVSELKNLITSLESAISAKSAGSAEVSVQS